MNYLQKNLTDDERNTLYCEIERLFYLHDRKAEKAKLVFFVNEINTLGVPVEICVKGIRDLGDADIKQIKYRTIKESILKKHKPDQINIKCMNCNGNGLISMMGVDKKSWSFACTCPAGYEKATVQKIIKWNGRARQNIKGKEYLHHDYVLMGEKEYNKHRTEGVIRND